MYGLKMVRRIPTIGIVALLAAACVTTSTSSRPPRSEFADISVPRGMTYQPDQSTVIESPTVKAARLVYRGRLEPVSLGQAMRATLEANGWRFVSTSSTPSMGTLQIYEKAGNSLQVRIHEDRWFGWFTYLEVETGRSAVVTQ
jgi:hypothetical protein